MIVQWVLPPIPCGTLRAVNPVTIECRIQKSRSPQFQVTAGPWNDFVSYAKNDVVYYNGVSYPGWVSLQDGNLNNTPSAGAWWAVASNLDFVQSDLSTVFYLDQTIFSKNGLGTIQRTISRQQGLLTPGSRSIEMFDSSSYSGHDGNGVVTAETFLGNTNARTLLNLIFDDPTATYTMFFSRITGSGYSTNRELYDVAHIDFTKTTMDYAVERASGTSYAIQKLHIKAQADSVVSLLNSFLIKDLISTIQLSDCYFGVSYPFIGGLVLLGGGPPPEFPAIGNKFPLNYNDGFFTGGAPVWYDHSRSQSRDVGTWNPGYTPGYYQQQNTLIVATSSINDGLHAISLLTLLKKMAALVNVTWNDSDMQTNVSFWLDQVAQTGTPILSSNEVTVDNILLCYEYLFNIDPRCAFGLTGSAQQTNAEMNITGGLKWNATVTDLLKKLATGFLTYIKNGYDQTTFRPENELADAVSPVGNPIPTNWIPGDKAGIKPRSMSALHVEVSNVGDSDIFSCPNERGTALSVQAPFRVKKMGMLGTIYGDSTVDIIQNGKAAAADQWKVFQPFTGGLIDGGHIIGSTGTTFEAGTSLTGTFVRTTGSFPNGLPSPYNDTSTGDLFTIEDTFHEFVITQGSTNGGQWNASNDIYGTFANYLTPTNNGNADTVCVWALNTDGVTRCIYGAVIGKLNRNLLWFALPYGGQNGQLAHASNVQYPYVIGYNGFGMDLTVTDGSANVTSAGGYDFNNNDVLGGQHLGQTIIIPARGIFTIKNVNVGGDHFTITLDRPIIGSGTNLEFRIGGPTPNASSFILGTYLYAYSGFNLGPAYNVSDWVGVGRDNAFNGFFPSFFLGNSGGSSTGTYGFYALSRARYNDGTWAMDGVSNPDDTFGSMLKTFAQCQAAMNLGSQQIVSRSFIGITDNTGSMTGYGPGDTYSEWSQGQQQDYRAQTMLTEERSGMITVEFIGTSNLLPINDTNYPVTDIGPGSSGAGGGGNSSGASGSGGGSPWDGALTIPEDFHRVFLFS